MKTIFEHIEHIQGKPHAVRKQIAFGAAAGTSALIALAWFAASLATGAFAIQGTSFASLAAQSDAATAKTSDTSGQGLAGAAAAVEDANAPAHIDIVDTNVPASAPKQTDQTVLPF